MSISPSNLSFILSLIKQQAGIHLTEEKLYLLESRLQPIAKKHHHASLDAFITHIRSHADKAVTTDVVEAMTTNESYFFRDIKPFEQFRDHVIPYLKRHMPHRKHLRIWSAACSTGQEPYSIAMTLLEAAKRHEITFEILATDIAGHVLKKAEEGLYTQFEVQRGVPITTLIKYFIKEDNNWRIKEELRRTVRFQQCNLVENFEQLGMFDVVFCRNVLIYFDPETKAKVLENIGKQLEPHGVLFLGGAESIFAQSTRYRPWEGQPGIHILMP